MGLKIISGNIFTSKCLTIVNTVNCVGVMGAGIALECRLRYPEMYKKYVELCENRKLSIGMLWLYKADDRWILNFPTKKHWKYPSKTEYIHSGLRKFVDTYESRAITSIAFPLLGTDKGGIDQDESLGVMKSYLSPLAIDIEIYRYDHNAKDDLYNKVRDWLFCQDVEKISRATRLRKDQVRKVMDAMERADIVQLNQLGSVKGIGIKTLEKLYATAQQAAKPIECNTQQPVQLNLNIVEQDAPADAKKPHR
ncbi:macro domain-containing protein [Thermodesulfobacteriota bacterium]